MVCTPHGMTRAVLTPQSVVRREQEAAAVAGLARAERARLGGK